MGSYFDRKERESDAKKETVVEKEILKDNQVDLDIKEIKSNINDLKTDIKEMKKDQKEYADNSAKDLQNLGKIVNDLVVEMRVANAVADKLKEDR